MSALPLPFLAIVAVGGLALILWRPFLTVALFGLLAPLGMTQLPASLDLVTLMSLVVVAAGLWQHILSSRSLLPSSWAAIAATVWSLGILGSVVFSSDMGRSAVLGMWQILAAWLAVSIAALVVTRGRLHVVLVCVLIGATIVAATGLSGGFNQSGAFDASIVQNRAMGVFSQPNEYGLYCSMVWVFSLAIACLCQGWLRALGAVCSVLSLAGLAASFSRGSWLGALIAAAVLAILVPQTRRPQTIMVISAVTVLAASVVFVPYWELPSLLFSRFTSIFGGEVNPYDNRPGLVAEGWRQWSENPIFGIGPNMYPVEASTIDSRIRTLEGQHAHNLFLTVGAEQGIVGLVALGLFIFAMVVAVRAARRFAAGPARTRPKEIPLGAAVTLAAMGALIALVAAGMVDYPLRNALSRSTAWLFIGLLLAGQRCLPRSVPGGDLRTTGAGRAGDDVVDGLGAVVQTQDAEAVLMGVRIGEVPVAVDESRSNLRQ